MDEPYSCGLCGTVADAWVLVCVMWPRGQRKGETEGFYACPEHLQVLRERLADFNPHVV